MTHEMVSAVAREAGYALPEEQLARLVHYVELLERDRELFDLTSIRERTDLVHRQVGESLKLLAAIESDGLEQGSRLVDVGSGGGVPGIPIAIARPDLDVTLIEARTRKAGWLEEAAKGLGLRARILAVPAEVAGRDSRYRESFDVAVAKALARLPQLLEMVMPLLKVGGRMYAAKGSRLGEEIEQAAPALAELAAEIAWQRPLGSKPQGPVGLMVRKTGATTSRFPRSTAALRKRPLGLKREKD